MLKHHATPCNNLLSTCPGVQLQSFRLIHYNSVQLLDISGCSAAADCKCSLLQLELVLLRACKVHGHWSQQPLAQ